MAIHDFGEKIGGAKKDLWKLRGMNVSDLLEMNDAEKLKLITKDNVWQKPDYAELVANGLPIKVAYFIKTVRDSLGAKPALTNRDNTPEAISDKQEKYIQFVGYVRDAVLSCKTVEDVLGLGNRKWLVDNGYIEGGKSYYVRPTAKAGDVITNKFLRAFCVTNYDISKYDREIARKQFLYTEEQKILSKYEFFKYVNAVWETDYRGEITFKLGGNYFYPKGEHADKESWEEGSYILSNARHAILGRNFESLDAAKQFALAKESGQEVEKPKKKGKTRFVPAQLAHIRRIGDDIRRGRSMTGQDFLNAFEFKGGEFGNWMSEKDRQASLNLGYEALYDLAKTLQIGLKDVSLGQALSIAFGARGSGNAMAHYEPMREVINLTKMKGAGSLAHEWAHALDDIVGKRLGVNGFMTGNLHDKRVPESLKKLIDVMKYKEISDEAATLRRKKELDVFVGNVRRYVDGFFSSHKMSPEQIAYKNELIDSYLNNSVNCGDTFFKCVTTGEGNIDIDALSEFSKEVFGHVITKGDRVQLAHYQNNIRYKLENLDRPQKVKTEFYDNSISFDKAHSKTDHGYWQSNEEMFARAFACYVADKVDGRSDYLCGHSDMAVTTVEGAQKGEYVTIKAFPVGEERKLINHCFDDFFKELKELNLLHHKDDYGVEMRRERKEPVWDRLPETEEEAYPVTLLDLLDDAYRRSAETVKEGQVLNKEKTFGE